MKRLVSRSPKKAKLYAANVKPDELSEYEKIKNKFSHESRVLKLNLLNTQNVRTGSYLLIEDIIFLEKKEEKNLRELLNYQCHHKKLKIYCVSHTVYKTKIWSMLPLFHYIIFTGAGSNAPVLRNVLDFYKIDKKQADRWQAIFVRLTSGNVARRKFFFFDCSNMAFGYTENLDLCEPYVMVGKAGCPEIGEVDLPSERNEPKIKDQLRERFFKVTQDSQLRNSARSLFDIIIDFLPLASVNEKDLSFNFLRRNELDARVSVSLVDYILSVADGDGDKPDRGQLALHQFISRRCVIPRVLKANAHFSDRSISH